MCRRCLSAAASSLAAVGLLGGMWVGHSVLVPGPGRCPACGGTDAAPAGGSSPSLPVAVCTNLCRRPGLAGCSHPRRARGRRPRALRLALGFDGRWRMYRTSACPPNSSRSSKAIATRGAFRLRFLPGSCGRRVGGGGRQPRLSARWRRGRSAGLSRGPPDGYLISSRGVRLFARTPTRRSGWQRVRSGVACYFAWRHSHYFLFNVQSAAWTARRDYL